MSVLPGEQGQPAEPAAGASGGTPGPLTQAVPTGPGAVALIEQPHAQLLGLQRHDAQITVGAGRALKKQRHAPTAYAELIAAGLRSVFLDGTDKTEMKLPRWLLFPDPRSWDCSMPCCQLGRVDMQDASLYGEVEFRQGEMVKPTQLVGDALTTAVSALHDKQHKHSVRMIRKAYVVFGVLFYIAVLVETLHFTRILRRFYENGG